MTTNYVVKFDWEGDGLLTTMTDAKNSMEQLLVALYNTLCAPINEHIEKWNNEWSSMGNEFPDEIFGSDYCKFMVRKHNELLDELTEDGWMFHYIDCGTVFTTTAYYGDELELHVKLESELLKSWMDVSFHLEETA